MKRLLLFAFLSLPFACGGAAPLPPPPSGPPPVASWPAPASVPEVRATPDAPFRQNAPAPGPAVTWSPPKIESWTLPNGVRVLFVERHDMPIVSVRIFTRAGAGDAAGMLPGAVAFMGAMLEQGAGKRTALGLSDDYEALGAEHGAWCDWDSCGASVKVLTSRLPAALDVLADVALRPTFPDAEVDRVQRRWVAAIQQEKSSPPAMEENALAAALYGRAHPFGHTLRHDVEKLKRADVDRAYRALFSPRDATIAAAGDVTRKDLESLLQARFGAWQAGAPATRPVPPAPARAPKAPQLVLVDVPGAAQSQVYVAQPGAAFSTPDRIPLGVMNAILGGMFSSRINLDLREEHAYTYGAHSRFSMRHGAGPFVAGGAMFADHTADAVRELLKQVTRIQQEPVTPAELADAKENARLALPARFERLDDVTGALEDLAVYDLPLDEYATRAARIDAVTAADVQRVAKQWLHPDAMRVVVTGDRAKIDASLQALGLANGEELRDASGEIAK
jgi:zinc protease